MDDTLLLYLWSLVGCCLVLQCIIQSCFGLFIGSEWDETLIVGIVYSWFWLCSYWLWVMGDVNSWCLLMMFTRVRVCKTLLFWLLGMYPYYCWSKPCLSLIMPIVISSICFWDWCEVVFDHGCCLYDRVPCWWHWGLIIVVSLMEVKFLGTLVQNPMYTITDQLHSYSSWGRDCGCFPTLCELKSILTIHE